MRRRLADESGMTLAEILIAMTIMLAVLGGVLTTFDSFVRADSNNNKRNDTAELARDALDTKVRQLRNLAKRVQHPVIDTLGSYDLIFQTSDPSRTWVRYCLNTSSPASTERARLWTAELAVAASATTSPVTSSMRGTCPGTGWSKTQVVADYVTNRRGGRDRPVFSYTCITGTSGCVSTPATYDQVVNIGSQLLVDTTPGTGPTELRVASAVYLRNQNQAPVAAFVHSRGSTSRTVVFNASGSTDYEGRTMDYYWFKDTMPAQAAIDCAHPTVTGSTTPRTLWGANGYLGEGITLTYTFPASDGADDPIGLVVCDPGDRFDTLGMPPESLIYVPIPS
jgi:type II secretory pathway pseudopilin PulG